MPRPNWNRFDEWLLVQPREEGVRLLTSDARLMGHPFAFAGERA